MTDQIFVVPDHPENEAVALDWQSKLTGKTFSGVRPGHVSGPVPDVTLTFTDGTSAFISVQSNVYFEGCLLNTLRKAAPVVAVYVDSFDAEDGRKIFQLEIGSQTFPLLILRAVANSTGQFPFTLSMR